MIPYYGTNIAQKWFKICAKQADNDVCNVQYRVVASTGQIITSVNLFTVTGKINRRKVVSAAIQNMQSPDDVAPLTPVHR